MLSKLEQALLDGNQVWGSAQVLADGQRSMLVNVRLPYPVALSLELVNPTGLNVLPYQPVEFNVLIGAGQYQSERVLMEGMHTFVTDGLRVFATGPAGIGSLPDQSRRVGAWAGLWSADERMVDRTTVLGVTTVVAPTAVGVWFMTTLLLGPPNPNSRLVNTDARKQIKFWNDSSAQVEIHYGNIAGLGGGVADLRLDPGEEYTEPTRYVGPVSHRWLAAAAGDLRITEWR